MKTKKEISLYVRTKSFTPAELRQAARMMRASARQLEAWAALRKHKEA